MKFLKTFPSKKIELKKPEIRDALLANSRARTGLEIQRITVGKVDFLRDVAVV